MTDLAPKSELMALSKLSGKKAKSDHVCVRARVHSQPHCSPSASWCVLRAGSSWEPVAPIQTKSGPLNSSASLHWKVVAFQESTHYV